MSNISWNICSQSPVDLGTFYSRNYSKNYAESDFLGIGQRQPIFRQREDRCMGKQFGSNVSNGIDRRRPCPCSSHCAVSSGRRSSGSTVGPSLAVTVADFSGPARYHQFVGGIGSNICHHSEHRKEQAGYALGSRCPGWLGSPHARR
jgi:hypothetical protein